VRSAHGRGGDGHEAVVELLRGAPTYQLDVPLELTTPTGAALLAALVSQWGPMPPITIERSGFGAGVADMGERPNLTQVVIGTSSAQLTTGQPVVLVEVNVDDATGETLAHAVAELLAAGAHDAWVTPILMKKGRPAHTVSALADPALAGQVAGVLTRETGSLGVRGHTLERWPQARHDDHVEVEGRAIRVKVSAGRVKVEHDDAVRVARQIGVPLREVRSRAEEAWRTGHPSVGAAAGLPGTHPSGATVARPPDSDAARYQAAVDASSGPDVVTGAARLGHLHDGHDHDHGHDDGREVGPDDGPDGPDLDDGPPPG